MSRVFVLAMLAALAAGSAHAQPGDRYGPAVPPSAPPAQTYAAAPQLPPPVLRTRMLSWPGKSLPQAAYVPARAPQPYAAPPSVAYAALRSPTYAPPAQQPMTYGSPRLAPAPAQATSNPDRAGARSYPGMQPGGINAAPDGFRPVYAASSPVPRAALPGSIYAKPGASTQASAIPSTWRPPIRGATADQRYGYDPIQNHRVRFYSVHRPFGIRPNPAPIPPQFFTNTADLTQPAGPISEERAAGTGKAVRAQPDTSVQ